MKSLMRIVCSSALVVACATAVHAQTCAGNIVSNPHFTDGWVPGSMPFGAVTDWSLLTASPQVVIDGCAADSGSIQMWGNQVVGESIQQQLPGVGIEANKIYRVTVCYRWLDTSASNPVLPQYVRFRLTVSGAAPVGYPATSANDVIGVTPNDNTASWTTYTFPDWTAPNNASYLTINPENDSMQNDGDFVSWGLIDDVCIERVLPVSIEAKTWGHVKTLYSDLR